MRPVRLFDCVKFKVLSEETDLSRAGCWPSIVRRQNASPFRYFKTSPEIIRLAVMMYTQFPLLLRNVEDLLRERGIDISHETIRFWWNRFGPVFAAKIRKRHAQQLRSYSNWQWHLGEIFVKINGGIHSLWRAVVHEGEVLKSYVSKINEELWSA